VSRIAFHRKGGQTRLDLLADVGRYRRRCWRSGPTWARTGIGDGRRDAPLNARAQLILLLYLDKRGRSTVRIHGRPSRTGRKDSSSRLWRPARALGTHAKQGPSTGHSAVGLRQAGNSLLTPRPHFTAHDARLVTRWLLLRTALLFVRRAVRLVYAGTPRAGSGLLAEASTLRAG
jgi:hypothetical protein